MAIFDSFPTGEGIFAKGKLSAGRGKPGTVAQAVTDGDTIKVILPGTQGLRFLGCDTPEKNIEFPGGSFTKLDDPKWSDYLTSVWDDAKWGKFSKPLSAPLKAYLKKKMKADVAENHWKLALAATKGLADLVEADRVDLKLTDEKFTVFAAFSHEVLDRYGRPLVFVNVDTVKEKRPEIYNVRMIAGGHASPFFMWPNVEPFRKLKVTDAAMPPVQFRKSINNSKKLQAARKQAAEARAKHLGIYNTKSPLQLDAFELRYLSRRAAPDRWVIDISTGETGSTLIAPDKYFAIKNPEDRLYIPAEYVPLFKAKGWN